MPYMTSQFLIRQEGDRPQVVPDGSTNLAFIGQFCEIKDDVVFTVEYSVRSAQMAVYKLLKIDKEPPAIYQGQRDLPIFIDHPACRLALPSVHLELSGRRGFAGGKRTGSQQ